MESNSISKLSSHEAVRKGSLRFRTVGEMAMFITENNVLFIDAVFADSIGMWHHCTFTPNQCNEDLLRVGFPLDGSSISLFTTVDKSDLVLIPDVTTCWIDPFHSYKTLHVLCDVFYPTGCAYDWCPRQIAKKAQDLLHQLNIGDTCHFGPEVEFFLFDDVYVKLTSCLMCVELKSEQRDMMFAKDVISGSGSLRSVYTAGTPIDDSVNLRSQMLLTLSSIGVTTEKHHHEAALSQSELGIKFSSLVDTADNVMTYKYVVRNVAAVNNKSVTFMPKPVYGENGSGLHVHQSLWKNSANIFFDEKEEYCNLSETALFYIGGILKHAAAIAAFTNPTTNSYRRLRAVGHEAPCLLTYSKGNRSAAIRIPLCDLKNPAAKRIECRFPDPSACPYLALSALILAGIDGIVNKLMPPPPVDGVSYQLPPEKLATIKSLPSSLDEALDALLVDHQFLSEAFSEEYIQTYVKFKRKEAQLVDLIPHPKEYQLYYHV